MERETGTFTVKSGLAEMLKGGVIMDVVTAEHAKVAETVAFLAGPGGATFTGVPVTMDLGWTAR